ncbi:MAG TPA: M15 family metallopeptidase [Candidatus Paenibacillus intestinavium]|nr:M15 family metallopeptidase [Candidatus Paenibacillus intestinavium]
MKKAIVLSCVAAVLIYLFVGFKERGVQLMPYNNNELQQDGYELMTVEEEMKYAGNLILVNKDYKLRDEGLVDDLVLVVKEDQYTRGYRLDNEDIKISELVISNFQNMVDDAQEDGITHLILNSGYRNQEKQASLYNEMGSQYALPAGYSEHNIGLSMDIGSLVGKMEDAPEGKWLRENAARFGFILRYPEDKVDITGIEYEPWHFRYVGVPHSVIMQDRRWVLEEYLQYVRENHNLQTTIAGKKYLINYYEFEQELQIKVPTNKSYTISGDNIKGVIVTLELGGQ